MKHIHFNRKKLLRAIYLACVAALLTGVSHAQVTAPYSTDFPGNSGALTTSTGNAGGVMNPTVSTPAGGGLVASFTSGSSYGKVGYIDATVPVTNLGPSISANNFTESTDFSFSSTSGIGSLAAALGALGDRSNFNAFSGNSYVASLTVYNNDGSGVDKSGGISLTAFASNGGTSLATGSLGPIVITDTYNLTLTGTYDGTGDLTLGFTVTDLNNPSSTTTISSIILAGSVLTGDNFGVEASAANRSAGAIHFNDFSVDLGSAVPEPSDYALMILGGVALLGVARRQKKVTG